MVRNINRGSENQNEKSGNVGPFIVFDDELDCCCWQSWAQVLFVDRVAGGEKIGIDGRLAWNTEKARRDGNVLDERRALVEEATSWISGKVCLSVRAGWESPWSADFDRKWKNITQYKGSKLRNRKRNRKEFFTFSVCFCRRLQSRTFTVRPQLCRTRTSALSEVQWKGYPPFLSPTEHAHSSSFSLLSAYLSWRGSASPELLWQ